MANALQRAVTPSDGGGADDQIARQFPCNRNSLLMVEVAP